MRIVEIGVEIKEEKDLRVVLDLLDLYKIPFYVEPEGRFASLEDLECQCEGK